MKEGEISNCGMLPEVKADTGRLGSMAEKAKADGQASEVDRSITPQILRVSLGIQITEIKGEDRNDINSKTTAPHALNHQQLMVRKHFPKKSENQGTGSEQERDTYIPNAEGAGLELRR